MPVARPLLKYGRLKTKISVNVSGNPKAEVADVNGRTAHIMMALGRNLRLSR